MYRNKGIFAVVVVVLNLSACGFKSDTPRSDLNEWDVKALQAGMESGELTAKSITQFYLDQIEKIDGQLNAVIEVNPEALTIAEQLDIERSRGELRSAMHGIPVLIKDNIDTADTMLTTAGSLALVAAPRPNRDAFVVQQLRDAGAIILGKTNLSEWANFRSSNSSSGWSSRGGQTHNPYILDRSPCGSSSGSAVAVAANLTAVAFVNTSSSVAIVNVFRMIHSA
jgi:amidase